VIDGIDRNTFELPATAGPETETDDIWNWPGYRLPTCGTVKYIAEVRAFRLASNLYNTLTGMQGRVYRWSPIPGIDLRIGAHPIVAPVGSGVLVGNDEFVRWSSRNPVVGPIESESGGSVSLTARWEEDGAPDTNKVKLEGI
jgi:hypothetical protein